MMFYYYSSIVYITVFVMVIMWRMVAADRHMSTKRKEGFITVFVLVLVVSCIEWLGELLNGSRYENVENIHRLVVTFRFIITPIIPFILGSKIFDESKKRKNAIFEIILVINAFIALLSVYYPIIFNIDADNCYAKAKFFWVYQLVMVIEASYLFIKCIEFSKIYQFRNATDLILILLFLSTGMLIQSFVNEMRTGFLTIAITSILFLIYYNNLLQYVDMLTRLLNQRAYKNKIKTIDSNVMIILMDVNDFKNINDTYGHNLGDLIISKIGAIIKEVYSRHGKCYRIGGDEFCVILENDIDELQKLNETFISKISEQIQKDERFATVSIGSALYDPNYSNINTVIEEADKRMYQNKKDIKAAK